MTIDPADLRERMQTVRRIAPAPPHAAPPPASPPDPNPETTPGDVDPMDQLPPPPEDAGGGGGFDGEVPPDFPADVDPALCAECSKHPLNDYGNALRLIAYRGEDLLFVPRVGWFVWAGTHWASDDDGLLARHHAQQISRMVVLEKEWICLADWEHALIDEKPGIEKRLDGFASIKSAALTDDQREEIFELKARLDVIEETKKKLTALRRTHTTHAKNSGNTNPITNMLREAQVRRNVPLTALNADPLQINTLSGVLQYIADPAGDGERPVYRRHILAPDRGQLISKVMPVEFDPDARCPVFDRFLATILPDDDVRAFVQRWFGYAITGDISEHKLAFFHGEGRNGKSTLVELIAKMLGPYATSVPIESLTGDAARKGSDATPDLVRLPGARMVRAEEPEQGEKLKEALIKALTGGATILVRKMQQEFVEVNPEFKLTISGNYKPEIRGTDLGIWRRVMLVPFDVIIPDSDVDQKLDVKLWAERSGILNWIIAGLEAWLEVGLAPPEAVLRATQEYREQSDPLIPFLRDCCVIDGAESTFIKGTDLNEAFIWWMTEQGEMDVRRKWGARTVSNKFRDKSRSHQGGGGARFWAAKSGTTGYRGIRLTDVFLEARRDAQAGASPPPASQRIYDEDDFH